jgi:hypothetical protein
VKPPAEHRRERVDLDGGRQGFIPPGCTVSVTPRRSRDDLNPLGAIIFKKVMAHGVAYKRRVVRKVRLFQNVRPVGADRLGAQP